MLKNFFSFVFELVKIVVISLAIIIPVRYFLIQPFYVRGESMEPNFEDYEYLIIDEISYRFKEPVRGDIIVFRYPRDPQEYFIKRVIGLPGEKLQFTDGKVMIFNEENPEGIVLSEDYLPEGTRTYAMTNEIISIKEGEYFVLGDNRNNSKDSRHFGAVDESFVTGRVLLRGWPFNKIGFFSAPEYQF